MAFGVPTTRVEELGPALRVNLLLDLPFKKKPTQASVYRVGDTLFDGGSSLAAPALIEALRGDPPRRIVLTHQHEDHAGGVAAIRRAFGGIPVFVPRAHVGIVAEARPVPAYRSAIWGHPEAIADAQPYDDGAEFDTGRLVFRATVTPGHTPGHMVLAARNGDDVWAITGDLYVTSKPVAAWYESACDDLVASLRGVASAGGEALRMLPTHGRARMDGAAAMTALADWLAAEADRVWVASDEAGTREVHAVTKVLYGDARDPIERYSGGEFSRAAFVRSVLEPVRALPAVVP